APRRRRRPVPSRSPDPLRRPTVIENRYWSPATGSGMSRLRKEEGGVPGDEGIRRRGTGAFDRTGRVGRGADRAAIRGRGAWRPGRGDPWLAAGLRLRARD